MDNKRENVIETTGLSKVFGGVTAIDDLSVTVKRGELRVLLGPNGAGKSTLFKLLMGVIQPSAGDVFYRGQKVTHRKTFQRVRLGLSCKFQNLPIYPNLSVQQNLFVPLYLRHRPYQIPERSLQLLNDIGLSCDINARAGDLSHGQQQWLAIAMAVATNPEVLLLDEPTAGMGPEETKETGKLVQSLNDRGVTVLVIEHDMALVRQLNAHVIVLHFGRYFAEGSIEEIENDEAVQDIYLGRSAAVSG